jgi:hypothetical protein
MPSSIENDLTAMAVGMFDDSDDLRFKQLSHVVVLF